MEEIDEKPWTINVASNQAQQPFYLRDGSETILPINGTNLPLQNVIVDNLIGGKRYKIIVVGVTEAGPRESLLPDEQMEIRMPIAGNF